MASLQNQVLAKEKTSIEDPLSAHFYTHAHDGHRFLHCQLELGTKALQFSHGLRGFKVLEELRTKGAIEIR